MNGANVNNTGKYAIAGGNEEIIHLCEQNHSSYEGAYATVIQFHRNDIFKFMYESKIREIVNLEKLGKECVYYHNYEIFTSLLKEGMKINDDIINEAAKIGNIFLMKYFLAESFFTLKSNNLELIKFILKEKPREINAKDICLFNLKFILIIYYFKVIFGVNLKYIGHFLLLHQDMTKFKQRQ